jgi:hypothetical protein
MVREERTPVKCQTASAPSPHIFTSLCLIPSFGAPHPHLTHLCSPSWAGAERPARKTATRGSWCGVGQDQARRFGPLGASSLLIPPWERDAGALQGGEGSKAVTERSLPSPRTSPWSRPGRPQSGWLRWGTRSGFSFPLEPSVLTLSLTPTPSLLLQDDVSTASKD